MRHSVSTTYYNLQCIFPINLLMKHCFRQESKVGMCDDITSTCFEMIASGVTINCGLKNRSTCNLLYRIYVSNPEN